MCCRRASVETAGLGRRDLDLHSTTTVGREIEVGARAVDVGDRRELGAICRLAAESELPHLVSGQLVKASRECRRRREHQRPAVAIDVVDLPDVAAVFGDTGVDRRLGVGRRAEDDHGDKCKNDSHGTSPNVRATHVALNCQNDITLYQEKQVIRW